MYICARPFIFPGLFRFGFKSNFFNNLALIFLKKTIVDKKRRKVSNKLGSCIILVTTKLHRDL